MSTERIDPSRGRPLSRRALLRSMAAGGATMLAGGAVLGALDSATASAASITRLPMADVTLKLSADPASASASAVSAMPTATQQKGKPDVKAYAEALQNWLDKNPGVTLKQVSAPKDTPSLRAAIAGNVAPSIFGDPGGHSAFAKGFAADVTALYDKYKTESLLTPYAKAAWQQQKYNGKWYGQPIYFSAGTGMYYRRDLIKQLGLKDPQLGWTWNDLRDYARKLTNQNQRRRGLAMEYYGVGYCLNASLFQFFAEQPAPKVPYHIHYDYLYRFGEYNAIAQLYRTMTFQDRSILSDISYDMTQVTQAFARGDAAMCAAVEGFYYIPPGVPFSPQNAAYRLHKPLEDVVGIVAMPNGMKGSFGESQGTTVGSYFDPHLDASSLDKAYNLNQYMLLGDGFVYQKQRQWEYSGHDPRIVYNYSTQAGKMQVNIPGIPTSPKVAWGPAFVDAVEAMVSIPHVPDQNVYFPGNTNPDPPSDAWQKDALSSLAYTQKPVADILKKVTGIRNQLAQQYQSSVSADDYAKAARAYYGACDRFWKKVSTTKGYESAARFYHEDFSPWYHNVVLPAIG